jgi:hypothetical protein
MPELLAEFSSSAYLTDTQLSRFKRIPQPVNESLTVRRFHMRMLCGIHQHDTVLITEVLQSTSGLMLGQDSLHLGN